MFFKQPPSLLAGRIIGLNELHPTTAEIEQVMHRKAGKSPLVAYDTVEHALSKAKAGSLDALVRKKMGDGTHGVGEDIWDVPDYPKRSLEDFLLSDALEVPRYIETDEDTRTFLDPYFA